MEIREIKTDKKRFLPLLLLADEQTILGWSRTEEDPVDGEVGPDGVLVQMSRGGLF